MVEERNIPIHGDVNLTKEGTTACKFWGLGSDGTVGANKSAIKIIGDKTDMYAQAYFAYDSKKSGGITMSHLRFGKAPIISPYLINKADFISCSQQSYVRQYDLLAGLKKGGTFLLNTFWSDEELNTHLPASMRRYIASNDIQFYTVDAVHIARELGLGGRFNMVMQSAFFKLANIIPIEDAVKYLKDAVVTSYGSKGEKVVNMNNGAIDHGIESLHRVNVPAEWKDAVDEEVPVNAKTPEFITKIQNVMNRQEGDKLKISELLSMEDGTFPVGGTAFEKRGTAISVPVWRPEKCIQCNQCSFVCPHATIRPVLTTDEELAAAPEGMQSVKSRPAKGLNLTIAVSTLDCLGCGNCAQVCPGKALDMTLLDDNLRDAQKYFDYGVDTEKVSVKNVPMKKTTVIGSQFEQPLFEFSGACAGCGETPYAKLVTQLFGDRMMIANATGCSSIWGASAPAIPYTKNPKGYGPAWANSLFEDNAEYGLGMLLGTKAVRESIAAAVTQALEEKKGSAELQAAMQLWLEKRDSGEGTRDRADLRRFGTGRRGRSPRRRRGRRRTGRSRLRADSGRRRRNGLRIGRHLDVEAVEDPADTINGLQGHPAAGRGLSTSAGTGRRIGRHREVEARLTGGRAGTVHSQVDVLTEELLVPGHGAHAAGPENLLGEVGVGQGVHRHCHRAGPAGPRDRAHTHLTLGVARLEYLLVEGGQVVGGDVASERPDIHDPTSVGEREAGATCEQLLGGGHDHRVRVLQDLPVHPDLANRGGGAVLGLGGGVRNDIDVGGQSQLDSRRIGSGAPLLGDERLELSTSHGEVAHGLVIRGNVTDLVDREEAVDLIGRYLSVIVPGALVPEIGFEVVGPDYSHIVRGGRRPLHGIDVGEPVSVGLGHQVGRRGLGAGVGSGSHAIRSTQVVSTELRHRLSGPQIHHLVVSLI